MKKQTRQAANDQRIAFSKAMIHWLQSKEYQVGLTGADLDIDEGADLIRSLLPTAVTLLGLGQVGALITPFLSSESGSEADRIKAAVTPYVPLADVLGLHRSGDEMLAVIYGDSLSDEELLTRFDMFLEFGRPFTGLKSWWARVSRGMWWSHSTKGNSTVYVLVVFFSSARAAGYKRTVERDPNNWHRTDRSVEHEILRFAVPERLELRSYPVNVPSVEVLHPWMGPCRWFEDEYPEDEWTGSFNATDLRRVLDLAKIYEREPG